MFANELVQLKGVLTRLWVGVLLSEASTRNKAFFNTVDEFASLLVSGVIAATCKGDSEFGVSAGELFELLAVCIGVEIVAREDDRSTL